MGLKCCFYQTGYAEGLKQGLFYIEYQRRPIVDWEGPAQSSPPGHDISSVMALVILFGSEFTPVIIDCINIINWALISSTSVVTSASICGRIIIKVPTGSVKRPLTFIANSTIRSKDRPCKNLLKYSRTLDKNTSKSRSTGPSNPSKEPNSPWGSRTSLRLPVSPLSAPVMASSCGEGRGAGTPEHCQAQDTGTHDMHYKRDWGDSVNMLSAVFMGKLSCSDDLHGKILNREHEQWAPILVPRTLLRFF